MSRALKAASGDVVVVATVPTIEPYGDIREYAVKMFENHGRGIGDKDKDNGLLILLAIKERKVWVEVGYGLEPWITDRFAGETSREYMVPQFRNGRMVSGSSPAPRASSAASRTAGRSRSKGVAREREAEPSGGSIWPLLPILIFIAILVISRIGRGGGGGGFPFWARAVERVVERRGPVWRRPRRRLRRGFRRRLRRIRRFGGGFGGFGGGGSGGGGGGAGGEGGCKLETDEDHTPHAPRSSCWCALPCPAARTTSSSARRKRSKRSGRRSRTSSSGATT